MLTLIHSRMLNLYFTMCRSLKGTRCLFNVVWSVQTALLSFFVYILTCTPPTSYVKFMPNTFTWICDTWLAIFSPDIGKQSLNNIKTGLWLAEGKNDRNKNCFVHLILAYMYFNLSCPKKSRKILHVSHEWHSVIVVHFVSDRVPQYFNVVVVNSRVENSFEMYSYMYMTCSRMPSLCTCISITVRKLNWIEWRKMLVVLKFWMKLLILKNQGLSASYN